MVAAVRDLAPVANVRLIVSQDFIAKTTREPVDRVDPLTDYVLGTTVHGTSHLVGTMAAFPVASDEEVRLEARLQGDADTDGRGYNGPVRANVVGAATVQATGDILFGPDGFHVGPDARSGVGDGAAHIHVDNLQEPACQPPGHLCRPAPRGQNTGAG